MPSNAIMLLLIVAGVILLIILSVIWNFGSLWVQSLTAGAPISIIDLVAMKLRRVPLQLIVNARITSKKASLEIHSREWEAHYLAGGKVPELLKAMITAHMGGIEVGSDEKDNIKVSRDQHMFNSMAAHVLAGGRIQSVIEGLISAKRSNIALSFAKACAIDLATLRTEGKSVIEAVTTSVNPRVIDCPDPRKGRATIDAVAKNGIQLKVKARVTVRTNLDRILGGATEETIIARVGEGIVSAIGSAAMHNEVLENPDKISKAVLAKGLDASTAFEIVSIDIADVDVGENIGANLRAQQAQADLQWAQADAEGRAAAARAREQEMRAQVEENRAAVVLAEADIPKAIAEALRAGRMGAMDYFGMRNMQADTHMREQFGGGKPSGGGNV